MRKITVGPFDAVYLTDLGTADPARLQLNQNLTKGQGRKLYLIDHERLVLLDEDGRACLHHSK
jgi:hypothetical protein